MYMCLCVCDVSVCICMCSSQQSQVQTKDQMSWDYYSNRHSPQSYHSSDSRFILQVIKVREGVANLPNLEDVFLPLLLDVPHDQRERGGTGAGDDRVTVPHVGHPPHPVTVHLREAVETHQARVVGGEVLCVCACMCVCPHTCGGMGK